MNGITQIFFASLPFILVIFAFIWAYRKSKKSSHDVPMAWYYFYTYIRLPLGIVLLLGMAVQTKILASVLLSISLAIFVLVVIYGLSNFKLWGWNMNMFLLVMDCLFYPIGKAEGNLYVGIGLFVTMALLWFTPNFVYFNKRKRLFLKGCKHEGQTGKYCTECGMSLKEESVQ